MEILAIIATIEALVIWLLVQKLKAQQAKINHEREMKDIATDMFFDSLEDKVNSED